MKRLITFFLLTLLCFAPISNGLGKANSDHTIAGYGPIGGDLILPSSTVIKDNKLYVLDQYGVSSFDLSTKQFLHRTPLDLGDQGYPEFSKPEGWMTTINEFSEGAASLLLSPSYFFASRYQFNKNRLLTKPKMCLDLAGNFYISTSKDIQVFSQESFTLLRKMPYQLDSFLKNSNNNLLMVSFKIYSDQIYLLVTTLETYSNKIISTQLRILSLDGVLLNTIPNLIISETKYLSQPDFILIPEFQLIALIMNDEFLRETKYDYPIYFFTMEGKKVSVNNKLPFSFEAQGIELNQNNQIILSGFSLTDDQFTRGQMALINLQIKEYRDGILTIEDKSHIQIEEFGLDCMDLNVNDNSITLVSTGDFSKAWDFKVIRIDHNEIFHYGTQPNRTGQIFGSLAYTIDEKGNLFGNSLSQPYINQFSEDGTWKKTFPIFNDLVSPFSGKGIPPFLLDMIYEKESLVLANLDPNTITSFSFGDYKWNSLFNEFKPDPLWFDIQYDKDTLYMLAAGQNISLHRPYLHRLNKDGTSTVIQGFSPDNIEKISYPFFIGFTFTDQEYQFLDCVNQTIWIYDFYTQNLKETIQLPKDEKSFYSSFDLYPDGSWIVTDVTQCRLLHISRKGDIIETIGSKGQVEIGTTKEAYLEKPDQFYLPIRAKIANNKIYVSDFGNFRYHIIPIQQKEEQRPQVEWEKDSLTLDKFSIFSVETFDFNYTISSRRDSEVQVSVSDPWMQVKTKNAKISDKKISIKILGGKLIPWTRNTGILQVVFPDFPEFNKVFPIIVNACGNLVKLTIGSNKASVNDLEVTFDSASIPLLKYGRTFVGLRFMAEIVFNKLAEVSFDPSIQTVFFKLGAKKIELFIGKPYALVNGKHMDLDFPPFIQAGRTFVPLRFVSENLDATVDYDAKAQSITITYPKKK